MPGRTPLAALLLALALCPGCAKQELYSDLAEREANEMMAVLMGRGIACTKTPGEEGTWKLSVPAASFGTAVDALNTLGYPRDTYSDIGQLFTKSGLVSSPTEERIRFVYALSQELSHTLSQIDGVLTARVHIVLPNNDPFGDEVRPSSAAVFIKHRQDADLDGSIVKIKELVIGSIEGLSADKVTVALFPAEDGLDDSTAAPAAPLSDVLSLRVAPDSVTRLWGILGVMLALAAGGLGFGVFSALRSQRLPASAP